MDMDNRMAAWAALNTAARDVGSAYADFLAVREESNSTWRSRLAVADAAFAQLCAIDGDTHSAVETLVMAVAGEAYVRGVAEGIDEERASREDEQDERMLDAELWDLEAPGV